VLFIHVLATVIMAARIIAPQQALPAFLSIELLLTVPSLALVLMSRRLPRLLLRVDALSIVVSLLALSAAISINRNLNGAVAVYHLFGICLYPIKLNLRPDFPFKLSAGFSLVYLPALIANAFCRVGVDPVASWCASILYVAVTGLGLSANYRMEASSRRIYLTYARETLHNAEIVDANRLLDQLARTDALTGLPNRRDFDGRFAEAAAAARSAGRTLTVLMLDIDNFKLYNDSMGHPQGDVCLRAIAGAVAASIGAPPCFVGRYGGEEFAVVLPDHGAEAAAQATMRVRASVQGLRLSHPALGDRRIVSVSIGVACLNPAYPETPEALIGRADAALYRAKRAGRDRAEIDRQLVSA
jgi:diguanylate cyclase (GGDEF)-like protein